MISDANGVDGCSIVSIYEILLLVNSSMMPLCLEIDSACPFRIVGHSKNKFVTSMIGQDFHFIIRLETFLTIN